MLINGALVNIITDSADKDGLLRSRTLFHCVGVYEIQIAQLPSAAAENVILFTATVPQYHSYHKRNIPPLLFLLSDLPFAHFALFVDLKHANRYDSEFIQVCLSYWGQALHLPHSTGNL